MTALLETLGLQKAFGAVVAASDVSVAVRRGQKLGLIGNNGAGKTTFVNIVTGHLTVERELALDPPDCWVKEEEGFDNFLSEVGPVVPTA